MPHTPGPYRLVILDAKLDDWTGARYVIRSDKHAPGGVAAIIGGTGEQEERANAHLFLVAPDLLEACRAQHKAIDALLAMVATLDRTFMPTQSGFIWDAAVQGHTAITKATEGRP
jgi:hypothetical protein